MTQGAGILSALFIFCVGCVLERERERERDRDRDRERELRKL